MAAPRKRATSRKAVDKKEDVKQEVTDAKVEDTQKQDVEESTKDSKPSESDNGAEKSTETKDVKAEQEQAVEETATGEDAPQPAAPQTASAQTQAAPAKQAKQQPKPASAPAKQATQQQSTQQQQPAQQPVVDDEQAEVKCIDINTILDDPDDDHETKLRAASESQDLRFASVSNVLLSHVSAHQSGAPEQSPEHTVGKLYTMERTLTAATLTQDTAERKSKLRIIELGFISSGQMGPLSYRGLVRYTELWRWGAELLETAKYETHVLTELSGKANDKKAVSAFDETAGGAIDVTSVIPEVVANLKAHFGY